MTDKILFEVADFEQELIVWVKTASDEEPNQLNTNKFDEIGPDHHFIGLLPGTDVLLTKIKLPKQLSHANKLKAIPYALEEQLAEDLNQLHFVLGDKEKTDNYPVAVLNKAKMALWKNCFDRLTNKSNRLTPILIPDLLLLPLRENHWSILIDDNKALIRTGECAGFSIEIENMIPLISLYFENKTLLLPEVIEIFCSPDCTLDFTLLEKLPCKFKRHDQTQEKLIFLSKGLSSLPRINLLQGIYQPFENPFTFKKIFTTTAVFMAAWLSILTLGDGVSNILLQNRIAIVQNEMLDNLKKLMPNASLVNSKEALEHELNNLRKLAGNNQFFSLMQRTAPALSRLFGIKLMNIKFENQILQLHLEADDFSFLDQLQNELRNKSLEVEQRNAKKMGTHIQADLIIREKKR